MNEKFFFLSLFSEIKEGVLSELDNFSRSMNEKEPVNYHEKLYILTSMEKILDFLLESPKFEKSYELIDESINAICQVVNFTESKNLMEKLQFVLNPMIKDAFLMILKWEDYLKNSWNKLKVY